MAKFQMLAELRSELRKASDPAKAGQMQAYMKSSMPFHGVPSPILKKVTRDFFSKVEIKTSKAWQENVLGLWRNAGFREERYSALAFAGDKRASPFQTLAAMPMYEELIVTGAWWDYVDTIASHRVGGILRLYPNAMKKKMLQWSRCPDIWKRRTSIISQLGFKKETDLDHLYTCIEPSLGSKEFFLQKAIGWALREYAWLDPKEIRRYVKANESRLSPLSKREALKNIIG
jgi:3-methyladenine DNA glycosylase AlkD